MQRSNIKEHDDNIFDEILNKIHAFGVKNYGKHPNWLYLNREHFRKLKASKEYLYFTYANQGDVHPKTILGMYYRIKEDQKEIEVQ